MADLETLAAHTLSRTTMDDAQLRAEIGALGPRWKIVEPDLVCELRGAPMGKCGKAAAYAATLADEMDHHPRIVLEYAGMTLSIHTHDANAITVTDLVYAARLERWLRANGWS